MLKRPRLVVKCACNIDRLFRDWELGART